MNSWYIEWDIKYSRVEKNKIGLIRKRYERVEK